MIYGTDAHVEAACSWWSALLADGAATAGQLRMFERRLAYEITTLAAQCEWEGEEIGELEITAFSWPIQIALLVSGLREAGANLPPEARTLIGKHAARASADGASDPLVLPARHPIW